MLALAQSSAPSIWVAVTGWLTPTVLFVALNIIIWIVAVASKAGHHKDEDENDHHRRPRLSRAPSVLERVRSFNLSFYLYNNDYRYSHHDAADGGGNAEQQQQPVLSRRPSLLERIKSIKINPCNYRSEETPLETIYSPVESTEPEKTSTTQDEVHGSSQDHHFSRSRSEADARPTTAEKTERRETKLKKSASDNLGRQQIENDGDSEEEKEVDARADDFISKFRQQLKLQRIDSIMRYTEMLRRGAR